MSPSHDSTGHDSTGGWLDDELRCVPLPDGMLARLRQIAAGGNDGLLDEQLREVALPSGLLARLRQIPDDQALDARLANVAIPETLHSGLRQAIEDAVLDERVADVAVPSHLLERLRPIARSRWWRDAWQATTSRRMALAASVLLAVGLTYFSLVLVVLWPIYRNALEAPGRLALSVPIDTNGAVAVVDSVDAMDAWTVTADVSGSSSTQDQDSVADANGSMAAEFPPMSPSGATRPPESAVAAGTSNNEPWDGEPWDGEPWDGEPWDGVERLFGRAAGADGPLDPLRSTWNERFGVFGADAALDSIPPLEIVRADRVRGILPPLVRGFDRLHLAKYGVHPFVPPAAHESLRTIAVPLSTETTSFDRLWQWLESGRRVSDRSTGLAGGRVRPEDFLAAMDYEFPPAVAGGVGLRTAAGPSPFARDGVQLVQIGAVAGPLAKAHRDPTYLTVAVDTSASMRWLGRMESVRRALGEVVGTLERNDRFSLVTFSDEATVVLTAADSRQGAAIRRALDWLSPRQGTNLGAGVQAACSVALEGAVPRGTRRRLVVVTDAPPRLDAGATSRMVQMLAEARRGGVEVTLIDVSGAPDGDEQLAALATAGRIELRPAQGADAARWILQEKLIGRSPMVAVEAELRITFNPKAVAAYRLVGHEAAAGLASGGVKADLRAGQAATALFQVVLLPGNVDDVATAEVTWRDPIADIPRQVTQRISRLQFATSLGDSPLSLQAAAVASEAAEILRGSYYTPAGSHSLARLRETARQVHPDLQRQAAFRRLVRLIDLAGEAGLGP